MGTSKVSVDINQRSFEIEVPDENVGHVLELLGHLFDRLQPVASAPRPSSLEQAFNPDRTEEVEEIRSEDSTKPKRKKVGNKGAAKVRPPELIELGLSPEQRQEMQTFFAAKAPKGQNDQVAVLGVKLKEFTQRSEFTVDEIHSAFKVVARPTPKNLTAVFGNMKRDGRAGYSDYKILINSYTEDFVNFHMSKADK